MPDWRKAGHRNANPSGGEDLRSLLQLAICLAFITLMTPPGMARADPFFDDLTGNWRGSGFVRIAANAQEENIRCRISNALHPNGHELIILGSCVIGGFFLPVDGSVVARGKSAYSATIFRTLARLTTSNFLGRRRGSSLALTFKGRDAVTKQSIRANMTIRKRGNGRFEVSLQRTDPETKKLFNVGTIRFRGK
jgi:hypothetical protein